MSDSVIMKFICEVKKTLVDTADTAMTYPKADPFEHGVSCGRHQGLQSALDILDGILKGDLDEDAKL